MASSVSITYLRASALAAMAFSALCAHADESDRLATATQARLDGEFDRAERLLETETAEAPGSADAWLQLGLVRSAKGEFDSARTALNRTLEIAPDYQDAELALSRIDWFEGRNDAALNRLARLERTPDVLELTARIETAAEPLPAPDWRITLGAGYSELTESLPGWSEVSGTLTRRVDDISSYTLLIDFAERFDQSDIYLEGRADRKLGASISGYVAAGGAPDAIFRPNWSLSTGLVAGFAHQASDADPVQFSADLRYADYPAGPVQSGKVGLAQPFDGNRFKLGASVILLSDEQGQSREGYALQGEWQAAASSRILFTYADAPETSEGVTLDVQSAVLGWRQRVSERQSVQINLVHEVRTVYDRTGAFVSTSVSF